jgi:hypothetical protein
MNRSAICSVIVIFVSSFAFSMDPSTPIDGNLYIETTGSFLPKEIIVYSDDSILHKRNILKVDGRLFSGKRADTGINIGNRTSSSDISWIDSDTFAVLTGNSDRYSHGILGDRIEATGFAVYQSGSLTADFELPYSMVFETLRALIADVIPENPGAEVVLTSSNRVDGSRIEIYSQEGNFLGNSEAIGLGFRWLHIIAVASFPGDPKPYIAIVKTPHINGVLELYQWNSTKLVKRASLRNVSTHQIGSDNLNMALVINMDRLPGPEFLIPSYDFRSLVVIKYSNNVLYEMKRFDLPGRISTNLYLDNTDSNSVWVGLENGKIICLSE